MFLFYLYFTNKYVKCFKKKNKINTEKDNNVADISGEKSNDGFVKKEKSKKILIFFNIINVKAFFQ